MLRYQNFLLILLSYNLSYSAAEKNIYFTLQPKVEKRKTDALNCRAILKLGRGITCLSFRLTLNTHYVRSSPFRLVKTYFGSSIFWETFALSC